jgi:hypothetical protein
MEATSCFNGFRNFFCLGYLLWDTNTSVVDYAKNRVHCDIVPSDFVILSVCHFMHLAPFNSLKNRDV